jgi:hypothetical protein
MPYATFPLTVRFESIVRIPHFDTRTTPFGGKSRQRVSLGSAPWYEIVGKIDPYTDPAVADTLMAFFEARKGSFEAFYFQNVEEAWRPVPWLPLTTYPVNAIVRPVTATDRSYKATVGGISSAAEPTWPITVNGTVSDGSSPNVITWRENTYLVTFSDDILNAEYVEEMLYSFGEIRFIEASE